MLPPTTSTLRARFDALSARERRMLGLLAFALLLFALYVLMRGDGDEEPVELTAPPPPPVASPPTVSYTPPPPPAPVAPPSTASATGLLLVGIFGGGPGGGAAILQAADGRQRLVRIGREFQPGTSLRSVGLSHAVIGGPGGDVRLELGKAGATPVAAGATAAPPPGGESSPEQQRRETIEYQVGLEPVPSGGYRIKPGARLPHLDRAGLQPGDVIVRVNGSGFDEERLGELSWEIANASRTEFEVIRNGRQIRMVIER